MHANSVAVLLRHTLSSCLCHRPWLLTKLGWAVVKPDGTTLALCALTDVLLWRCLLAAVARLADLLP
jgi:hypothetical protein